MHRLDMVLLSGPRTDQLVQLIVILEPPEHVAEAPVLPLRMSGRVAKRLPLGVVSDGDRYPVVLTPAAIDALRRVPFTAVADTLRHSARQRVAGERDHDDVRLDRLQRFVIEPELRHHARSKAFRDYIGVRHEPLHEFHRVRIAEIQGEGLLPAVAQEEVPGPVPVIVLPVVLRHHEVPRDIHPLQPLELYHIRPYVRQDARASRPRIHLRKVEHLDAVKGKRHVTPRSRSTSWSSASYPTSPSTSCECSPSSGERPTSSGVSDILKG